jgi:hypothetical protein
LIDISDSITDVENVSIPVVQGEVYYVQVYGFGGDTNPDYDLEIGFTHSGDYNGDLTTDAADFVLWRTMLDQSVAAYTGADGSGNGIVGPEDHGVWAANFGEVLPAGAGNGAQVARLKETVQSGTVAGTAWGEDASPGSDAVGSPVVISERRGNARLVAQLSRGEAVTVASTAGNAGRRIGSRLAANGLLHVEPRDAALLNWVASRLGGNYVGEDERDESFAHEEWSNESSSSLFDAVDVAIENLSTWAA